MTEEKNMIEFGSNTGQVIKFFNRKGYGFIKDLNDNKDYFVHNTDIKCKDGVYRKLYPGEFISYNLIERDGKQVCSDVKGIMGYPLLVENEDHTYRVFPKSDRRMFNRDDSSSDSDSDSSDNDSTDSHEDNEEDTEQGAEQDAEPEKEFINKEAPEGIEVAEFDGLNINEEMG
jgi:cold shock CspA family protein